MLDWTKAIGLKKEHVYELEVSDTDRAFYSKRTIDFEFEFPFGRSELYGLAYRTDYDLSRHAESSKVDLVYLDEEATNPEERKIIPHCIEPSFGVDRTVLAILSDAYTEDIMNEETRSYLKLAPSVAPVKVAVFPLLKNKIELVKKAREIFIDLKREFGLTYLFISHDLSVVYQMCDRIMVMNRGCIEELNTAENVFHHSQSEYTRSLLEAIPR